MPELFDVTLWISIFSQLLLITGLIILPNTDIRRNTFLLGLMCCITVHLVLIFWLTNGYIQLRVFGPLAVMFILSYGPSLYFYLKHVFGHSTKKALNHFVLWQSVFLGAWLLNQYGLIYLQQWMASFYIVSVPGFYLLKSILLVMRSGKRHIKGLDRWTYFLTATFAMIILVLIMENIMILLDLDKYLVSDFNLVLMMSFVLLTMFIPVGAFMKMIVHPQLFSRGVLLQTVPVKGFDYLESEIRLLDRAVLNEQNYLKPGLSRADVSELTGLSVHRISELVNGYYESNFNDWVNQLRIKQSLHLMKDTKLSIKEIYYSVGFNSKSAFYSAFRTNLNMSPSEYRKLLVKSEDH